ncbi:MAG: serine/threonine protein kinase [Pseudomonadota bacterium]
MSTFELKAGRILGRRYEVIDLLGAGWEGEVYLVRERFTDIERAVKLFYPERNPKNRVATNYAKKLHRLRECEALIQYLSQEIIRLRGQDVTMLVSEYVEGKMCSAYVDQLPGKRMPEFEALHLTYALASAVAPMHRLREYHGDLHGDNIMVLRRGLRFDIKLLDVFNLGHASKRNIHTDVCDIVRLFYDVLGGRPRYARQRPEIKQVICGLKRSLITRKFPSAEHLKLHLENIVWQ